MWKFQRFSKILVPIRKINTQTQKFIISNEVKHGLENGAPIVALESTIITHGMPYPKNLECALGVEKIIREQGAIPATIAILAGEVTVGLNNEQIDYLANTNINKSVKTSRRDFPYVLSKKLNGGTTVAGTIIVAEKVGIPVFVTGGIGGVHRKGENTLDISADLTELGRSPIAVVSSGVKSILDIPRTLEYLETQGVLVATFGNSTDFPAFYSRISGSHAPFNVSTVEEAAAIIDESLKFGLNSGILFGVPVPAEHALEEKLLEQAIEQALKEAENQKIMGKNVTPFLLSNITSKTFSKSLEANIALIQNNAKIGAQIAIELSKKMVEKRDIFKKKADIFDEMAPIVIGGCVLDCCASIQDPEIKNFVKTMYFLTLGAFTRRFRMGTHC